MLDVHPPHESVHTWRDFFIHIATIVIGLLIAVGLEQTVEAIHHRHQVSDTRAALQREQRQNIRRFAVQTRWFHELTPSLRTNLAILVFLRSHPHAPPAAWPGQFYWGSSTMPYSDAAWKTAQQDGVVEHMPQEEVQRFADIYTRLATIRQDELEERAAMEAARGFRLRDPDPSHLTPAALDKVIECMTQVLVLHLRTAGEQSRLFRRIPDFTPAPNPQEINDLLQIHFTPEQIAHAQAGDRELKEIDDMP